MSAALSADAQSSRVQKSTSEEFMSLSPCTNHFLGSALGSLSCTSAISRVLWSGSARRRSSCEGCWAGLLVHHSEGVWVPVSHVRTELQSGSGSGKCEMSSSVSAMPIM